MATITKPIKQAFVLSSQKADAFLKQDNRKFKNAMENSNPLWKKKTIWKSMIIFQCI
jgi:hypothetical protein